MYVGLMHKIIPLDRTPVIYEWYMMARFLIRVFKYSQMLSKNLKRSRDSHTHTQSANSAVRINNRFFLALFHWLSLFRNENLVRKSPN